MTVHRITFDKKGPRLNGKRSLVANVVQGAHVKVNSLLPRTPNPGHEAWKIIHEKEDPTPEWFYNVWVPMIPSGSCGCSQHVNEILMKNPPRYDDWFPWTVEFHNTVNAKLDRRTWTLEEAYRIWKSERLYALCSPGVFGGIERWSLSLASNLPCYGFINETKGPEHDPALMSMIRQVAPDRTLQEVNDANKTLLVSGVHNFKRLNNTVVAVIHGCCEYTRTYLDSMKDQCDHFVSISRIVARQTKEWFNIDSTVIENGIDVSRLKPLDSSREKFGLPYDHKVMGMNGRLTKEKGVYRFLDALKELPDYWGFLIGWGDTLRVLQYAQSIGVANRLTIHHAIDQIGNALNVMDVYVSSSDSEGFGLSVMEALAFGLPVVCTDTGVMNDLREAYGDFGPAYTQDIVAGVKTARPASCINFSHYTAERMAKRWKNFLERIRV